MISSVILIGSGNVARNLANAFLKSNVRISGVWSRNAEHAREMAETTNAPIIIPESIRSNTADLVLLCISDSAIPEIAERIAPEVRIAHTSGAFDQKELGLPQLAVFYPLQTFTRSRLIAIHSVPLLIEAIDTSFENELVELANKLSSTVRRCSASDRKKIHVSAVWINNFVNHMIQKAKEFADSNNIEFDLLGPLLKETVQKALELGPYEAQTGPAIRNDLKTIEQHLELMNDKDRELYRAITKSIIETYHQK
jgi:predicted short-subunit dehydrogenase-like oxidoreductase (DUF2520 family)